MKVCLVEGCSKPVKARGWCPMHYSRWAKYGEVGQAGPLVHVVQHGTMNEYSNYNCRCDACKAAASEYQRNVQSIPCSSCGRVHRGRFRPESLCQQCRYEKRQENLVHGREAGYKRGCRCDACREAGARARRERRHRNDEVRLRENRKRMEAYYASRSPVQKATA